MVTLFRCAGSGLFFPADYVQQWGRKYGLGLGPRVVSEVMETAWQRPCAIPKNLRTPDQVMYPMGNACANVDAVTMSESEAKNVEMAILMKDDPFYVKIAKKVRDKQLKNTNGRLKAVLGVQKIV